MEQIINGAIMIIIGGVGIALGYFMPHVNSALTALSSNSVLANWAKYLIRYAQEFVSRDNKTKMDWVVNQLLELSKNSKIKLSEEQIRALSEGIYNEIKQQVREIEFAGQS